MIHLINPEAEGRKTMCGAFETGDWKTLKPQNCTCSACNAKRAAFDEGMDRVFGHLPTYKKHKKEDSGHVK